VPTAVLGDQGAQFREPVTGRLPDEAREESADVIAERYTGSSVRRSEDPRILTGKGRYVGDVDLPEMLHAAFVRSTLPHARLLSIDVSDAKAVPGVVAVFTGADVEGMIVSNVDPVAGLLSGPSGPAPHFSLLATTKVRLVGDPVVVVVAENRYIAEDACELVEIEYEALAPVPSAEVGLDPASTPLFENLGSNILSRLGRNEHGDVAGVFARADKIYEFEIRQHRHQNAPMETRGCVASFDPESGVLTVHTASQGVHFNKVGLIARLDLDPDKVRVVAADIGGSFGLKVGASREEVAVSAVSRALCRPIKWIEDRIENLSASAHAREESFAVRAAVSDAGDLEGLDVKMVVDAGAYGRTGSRLPSMVERMIPGCYKLEALGFEGISVTTNKAGYGSYRGPWASETFVRERVLDLIAKDLGMEPIEMRLRNVAVHGDPPPRMVTGRSLVGVTAKESLERMAELVEIAFFRARQAEARRHRRYLGLGLATFIEGGPRPSDPSGMSPLVRWEPMGARLETDGTVSLFTGQMPHGQSHETTFAQIAADELGVPFEQVRVVVGNTDVVPFGFTGGSRAARMAGGATLHTTRLLKAKVLEAAAAIVEASADDLEITDGKVAVRGVPASAISLSTVARQVASGALGSDVDLDVTASFDGGEGGWAGGTHCAIVEVDTETGLVDIERYVAVEDCGVLINPAIVEGQIRGGVAQGIGAVLLEHAAYDEDGNFQAATFMDYLLPTTCDVPRIEIEHLETVPLDPDVNFRGIGEGGMIVAPPTIVNAIEDALTPFGVRIYEQHLPPVRILELIDESRSR
jgi:carbon-monoxide dehydrogenase large subunit